MKKVGKIKGVNIYSDPNVPEDKIVATPTYSNELEGYFHKPRCPYSGSDYSVICDCHLEIRKYIQQATKAAEVRGRLDELVFLLEDFGVEDNVEPIKKRIAELQSQLPEGGAE